MIEQMHWEGSQLAGVRITANVISPDMLRADLIKPDRIPVRRFGRPKEVAQVAVMPARDG